MDINLRKVGKYIDCRITDSGTTIALGLHDASEATKLASELLAASIALQEHADENREGRADIEPEPGCSPTNGAQRQSSTGEDE